MGGALRKAIAPRCQLSALNPCFFPDMGTGWVSWFLLVSLAVGSTGVQQKDVRASGSGATSNQVKKHCPWPHAHCTSL